MYMPTLHKPVPLGTRVRVSADFGSYSSLTGVVVGISSIHVIFQYIVLLDTIVESEYGQMRAAAIPGTHLETENGQENFRRSI